MSSNLAARIRTSRSSAGAPRIVLVGLAYIATYAPLWASNFRSFVITNRPSRAMQTPLDTASPRTVLLTSGLTLASLGVLPGVVDISEAYCPKEGLAPEAGKAMGQR